MRCIQREIVPCFRPVIAFQLSPTETLPNQFLLGPLNSVALCPFTPGQVLGSALAALVGKAAREPEASWRVGVLPQLDKDAAAKAAAAAAANSFNFKARNAGNKAKAAVMQFDVDEDMDTGAIWRYEARAGAIRITAAA